MPQPFALTSSREREDLLAYGQFLVLLLCDRYRTLDPLHPMES